MKISVMLFPYHGVFASGACAPQKLVECFAACGVRALEPMKGFAQENPDAWEALDEAAKAAGMSYSCYDVGLNLVVTDKEARQQVLKTVQEDIRYASDVLHCPNLMLCGSRQAQGMSIPEGRRIYGQMLGECAELAEGTGTRICIENFGVYKDFAAASDACMEVLAIAGDKVGFVFDNGNFLYGGDSPTKAFDRCRGRICHVHVKDIRRNRDGETGGLQDIHGNCLRGSWLGQGIAEVRECLALLKGSGYDGWLSEENNSSLLEEAAYGLGFMQGAY